MTEPTAPLPPRPPAKRPITDIIEARAEMINGNFTIEDPNLGGAMKEIRSAIGDAAKRIRLASLTAKKCDKSALKDAMKLLQQAKNAACDSLILPNAHYPD